MSIRSQFLTVIVIICLISAGLMGYLSYQFSKQAALQEAQDKVEIISSYTKGSHQFFRNQSIPLVKQLVGKERFYPELMSIFVMTRHIADFFQKEQPGYTLKNATVDPLWEENRANPAELSIINTFKADQNLKKKIGIIKRQNQDFFYQATPMKVEKKCLRCHGDPLEAPKDQLMIYGDTNGYHWKLGDTVSAMFIYVPVYDALAAAKKSAIKLVVMGGGCMALSLVVIILFLGIKIVNPLEKLSKRAEEISLGKNMNESISIAPNREIKSLSRAIDRLRMSIYRMINKR